MLNLFLGLWSIFAVAAPQKLSLSSRVYENKDLSFAPHEGTGPFDTYLSMEIQFGPIADLFKQLVIDQRTVLTNRAEAHITVITPVEFQEILKSKISIKEINELAKKNDIQSSSFTVVCLGEANLEINGKIESTFYVVVRSPELLQIRENIQKAWIKKGGDKDLFKPEYFFPHITLGYTLRDLHMSDGVIKDESSCIMDIEIKK